MLEVSAGSAPRRRHQSPHPGMVATVFMLLFFAGLLPVTLLFADTHFPAPSQSPGEIAAYFRDNASRVSACAFLHFGAAIPLGIYTASMTSRLRFLGVRAAGVDIALFGGFTAALMVLLSAVAQWTLARPGISADETLTQALYYFTFAMGGPGYTVPLGLLMAGIAVPGLVLNLLPRYLAWAGLGLAAIGVLSVLCLLVPHALFLVPLTRFPAFVWLILAGFELGKMRAHRTRTPTLAL